MSSNANHIAMTTAPQPGTPEYSALAAALFGPKPQPAADTRALKFKHLTDEQDEAVEKILGLEVHPSWDIANFGYYYIDISGQHKVFYTLWRFKPTKSPYVNPEQYICNLSIDPIEAATKARQICGIAPVMMDAPGNREGRQGKPTTLSFGKYRGEHLGDVWVKDPKYFVFLHKLIKQGDMKRLPSAENQAMIQYYNDLYWEQVTKTNQETSTSAFVGTIGEKLVKPRFTVVHVSPAMDYTTTKMVDEQGNKFITYSLPESTKAGDVLEFESATIKDHREKLGVKFTVVNYLRALKAPKVKK